MNLHTKLSGFYLKITLNSNDVNMGVATGSRGVHAYPPPPPNSIPEPKKVQQFFKHQRYCFLWLFRN